MSSLSHFKKPRKVLPTHLYDEASLQVFWMPRRRHMVPVFIWCQSTMISSPQPSSPPNARWLRSNLQLSHDSSSWQFTLVPNLQQQSRGHYQNPKKTLNISVLYSDSTIALSWIKADPARWHTFVSNRVFQIQSMLPTTEFVHVPSEENAADLCSRGLLATQLVAQQTFWFQGPSWLGSSFPDHPQTLPKKEEARQEVKTLTVLTSPSYSLVNLDNFKSLVKLLRTLCICKVAFKKDLKAIFGREEMALALLAVVRADQMVHFEAEFRALSNDESINPKSSKAPLYPFMDNGVIRVGGRLAHGYSMTDDQRFPSHRSKLATLAINDAHLRTLHGGSTATVAELRRQIWVTQAMKKASACVKKCVTCFRFNSGPTQQLMGDLPSKRIVSKPRTCFLLCRPRLRNTSNIQEWK